jgi:fatty acid desaturase
MWLFAAVDAWRMSRFIRAGIKIAVAEDLWMQKLIAKPLVWAIAFIGLGTMFFLHTTLGLRLPVGAILPLLLVGLGVYWLIGYFKGKKEPKEEYDFSNRVVRGNFPTASNFTAATDDFPTVVSNQASRFQR